MKKEIIKKTHRRESTVTDVSSLPRSLLRSHFPTQFQSIPSPSSHIRVLNLKLEVADNNFIRLVQPKRGRLCLSGMARDHRRPLCSVIPLFLLLFPMLFVVQCKTLKRDGNYLVLPFDFSYLICFAFFWFLIVSAGEKSA